MTSMRVKHVEVPLEIYEEFCAVLDAGIQFFDERNDGDRSNWTDSERRCVEFIEEREWDKPKKRGNSRGAMHDDYKGWDVDHI